MKFLKSLLGLLPIIVYLGIQVVFSFVGCFVYIFTIALQYAGSGNPVPNISPDEMTKAILMPVTLASQACAIIVFCIWYYIKYLRGGYRPDVIKKGVMGISLNAILVMLVAYGISNYLLQGIAIAAPSAMMKYEAYVESALLPEGTPIGSFIAAVILAPIVEELCFRGLTVRYLRLVGIKKWWVIIIQAAIFAIAHMQPVQSSYAFINGIFMGILMYKYDSILVTTLAHMFFNLIGSYVLPPLELKLAENGAFGIYLIVWGVVIIALGTLLYFRLFKQKDRIAVTRFNDPKKIQIQQ